MRVMVLAPDLNAEAAVLLKVDAGGHEGTVEPAPQAMCSALYRDPDAVGVISTTSSAFAAVTCRDFRQAGVRNLLFVLLADADWHHSSAALILRCGADDVQPASLDSAEFLARLDALSRRGEYRDHLTITMPGCVLNVETGWAEGRVKRTRLTAAERRVLAELAREPDRTISKAELMDRLYGGLDEEEPEQKIIDVFICKLRSKLLELNDGLDVVETVWGQGYRFVPEGYRPNFRASRVRARA